MPRQPRSGAGAAGRAPSGAAARAPATQPSAVLSPQRYGALRARYNALLVTLYERTSLTVREIAALAGHTDRSTHLLVRALGCRPRNVRKCPPGTSLGVRRAGPKPPPLNGPATRRVAAAFAEVAREIAALPEKRAAQVLQRATERAHRRTMRTQTRVMTSVARQIRHVAAAVEDISATRDILAGRGKRSARHAGTRKRGEASKPVSRADVSRQDLQQERRLAQERLLRQQESRMWEAHKAAATAGVPGFDADTERRINETAARYDAEPRRGPRIRWL